jgi:hypothetical protein
MLFQIRIRTLHFPATSPMLIERATDMFLFVTTSLVTDQGKGEPLISPAHIESQSREERSGEPEPCLCALSQGKAVQCLLQKASGRREPFRVV